MDPGPQVKAARMEALAAGVEAATRRMRAEAMMAGTAERERAAATSEVDEAVYQAREGARPKAAVARPAVARPAVARVEVEEAEACGVKVAAAPQVAAGLVAERVVAGKARARQAAVLRAVA